jgi:caa(3)-type oxidase subunit IV
MTLAEYRGGEAAARPEGHAAREPGAKPHPEPLDYIKIGLVLAVVTAIEVALYYIELNRTLMISLLLVLSAIKFALVVLWFMHLRFDNRLFAQLFVAGFLLTLALFAVVLATMGRGLV